MLWFMVAALLEIVGCYAVWIYVREGRSAWWLGAAVPLLLAFAAALTRAPTLFAGRAYAAYAGIYLLGALAWLWAVDDVRPDRWDLVGAFLAVLGTLVILYGPRGADALGGG